MQEPQSWRELLGSIVGDPQERLTIAQELGVSPVTLSRWVNKESDPRPQNLRHLVTTLPAYREMLIELISEEFPDFSATIEDDSSKEIPSTFYSRIFHARASTNDTLRFWSISHLILQQALGQLDPNRLGMSIIIVRCMYPHEDGKIHSLRESTGLGTPPWNGDLEQKSMFLGAESLAGFVVTSCRSAVIQNIDEDKTLLPAHHVEHEKSAAAYPIMFAGRVAGCLLVSSTYANHFLSQSRLTLIKNYADLVSLAFEAEEFYDPRQIELRIVPLHSVQKTYFSNFRQRVAFEMIQASQQGHSINNIEAEKLVWQQLEKELLDVSMNINPDDLV